jgi:hypothetical protein
LGKPATVGKIRSGRKVRWADAYREAAYGAVFSTLYGIGDPGVDGDEVFMLHEELLMADPSGMEGRPGSAAAA